jgi:hypothetical protein
MSRPPSLLARSLEPLIGVLWPLFLVWTAIVAGLWMAGDEWPAAISNPGLRAALALVARFADAVWLVLAATSVHLHLAEKEGLARARLVGAVVLVVAGGLAAASVWSGQPLGHLVFTSRLGLKFGPVPLGWPLLWLIVVVGGRDLAGRIFPRAGHGALALVTGLFALLTDLNLEPIATGFRWYWFWYEPATRGLVAASWQNYAVWFVAASALAWFAREHRMASPRPPSWRPALAFIFLHLLLLAGHLRAVLSP